MTKLYFKFIKILLLIFLIYISCALLSHPDKNCEFARYTYYNDGTLQSIAILRESNIRGKTKKERCIYNYYETSRYFKRKMF